jgi:hypothetical protein
MHARWTSALVALALCLCAGGGAAATQVENDYRQALMTYFSVSEDVIRELEASRIGVENIPVALLIHQRTGLPVGTITELREGGDTWMEIASAHRLRPQDFYVIVVGQVESKTYTPIITKFKSTPINQWDTIELTDTDIVNLVNLKFIASQHDYSIFKAMALRDQGKDFTQINHEVKILKAELIRSQQKNRKTQNSTGTRG